MGMETRRQFLAAVAVGVAGGPLVLWFDRMTGDAAAGSAAGSFPLTRSDADWRRTLSPIQYRILRSRRTERPYSSPFNTERRHGLYRCAGCGQPVFSSHTKFDSRTGWPSFWAPIAGAIGTRHDRSLLMVRTEVHCSRCGGHLGHVFADGPPPTGLRYCINGAALTFEEA